MRWLNCLIDEALYLIFSIFRKKRVYHIKRHCNDPDFDVYVVKNGELTLFEKDVPCFLIGDYLE